MHSSNALLNQHSTPPSTPTHLYAQSYIASQPQSQHACSISTLIFSFGVFGISILYVPSVNINAYQMINVVSAAYPLCHTASAHPWTPEFHLSSLIAKLFISSCGAFAVPEHDQYCHLQAAFNLYMFGTNNGGISA